MNILKKIPGKTIIGAIGIVAGALAGPDALAVIGPKAAHVAVLVSTALGLLGIRYRSSE